MGPEVGRGNFGTTHEAFWRGSKVALKKVRVESEEQAVSFLREVEVCIADGPPQAEAPATLPTRP